MNSEDCKPHQNHLYVNGSREEDFIKIRPEELGVLDQLLDDVRNLKSRSNIVKLCEMTVRMRRHAPFNVMLIYLQRPNVTHVQSAADWRALGRFPKAEALPIVILRAFGPVEFVFDVADTEGKPIPEQLELGNLGGNAFGADGSLSSEVLQGFILQCHKFHIAVVERNEKIKKAGQARWIADDFIEIELNINHRTEQKFCTLCHELAHVFCGHPGTVEGLADARDVKKVAGETEAELCAFLIARRFGVTPNTADYLGWYSSGGQVPDFSLEAVLVAAGKIEALFRGNLRRKKAQTRWSNRIAEPWIAARI